MNKINSNFKKLFEEKKFSEIIFLIENLENKEEISPGLLNLLGVSRLSQAGKKKDDYLLSLKNFESAYLKEKKSQIGLESLRNFINVTADYYTISDLPVSFDKVFEYFNEAIINFKYDRELIHAIIRVYKRCNNINKIIDSFNELIKNSDYRTDTICSFIYHNCLIDKWKQSDFLNYGKFLDKKISKFPVENLIKLDQSNKSKVRIGFVSADIRSKHSITHFLKTILLNYDKNKFEISLYLNINYEDETTNEFKNLVFKTRNISKLTDIEAINIIRGDKNDIVVDLMGVTGFHRIVLFKNRLAPIQINWLGYCNTSGLREMDYIISDPHLIYPEEENLYSEKVVFMPNIWNCHSGFKLNRSENILPFIKNNYITFGSFNNFNKINDDVANTWSLILKKIKNSKLILKPSFKQDINRLKNIFKKNSILNSVIFYENIKNFDDHLKLYKKIDIALDTFPYNGVTTSFEAIWMNVPVLTLKGYNFNSRCGNSINSNLKMYELIADNKHDYINKAIYLSNNVNHLLKIRKEIYQKALSTPLFDSKSFSVSFFDIINNLKKNHENYRKY